MLKALLNFLVNRQVGPAIGTTIGIFDTKCLGPFPPFRKDVKRPLYSRFLIDKIDSARLDLCKPLENLLLTWGFDVVLQDDCWGLSLDRSKEYPIRVLLCKHGNDTKRIEWIKHID